MNKLAEIGISAVKTQFSDLVRQAGAGASFVIAQQGVPMAMRNLVIPLAKEHRIRV